MNTYKVKREITLLIEADSREQAVKHSSRFCGESNLFSTDGCNFKWNCKSRLASAIRQRNVKPEQAQR